MLHNFYRDFLYLASPYKLSMIKMTAAIVALAAALAFAATIPAALTSIQQAFAIGDTGGIKGILSHTNVNVQQVVALTIKFIPHGTHIDPGTITANIVGGVCNGCQGIEKKIQTGPGG